MFVFYNIQSGGYLKAHISKNSVEVDWDIALQEMRDSFHKNNINNVNIKEAEAYRTIKERLLNNDNISKNTQ